jgi:hypothetical protein
MTAIVAVETVLLVLLIALVAGLLRSNAEILRRLGPDAEAAPELPSPASAAVRRRGLPAPALSGATPAGDVVMLSFEGDRAGPTLLAFLTTGCSACAGFWSSLGERRLPAEVQTVIVTHGAERERPAALRELSPEAVPVVMSSAAWGDYAVPGAPYFVLVDGGVRGEGAASSWPALASLVGDAIEDARDDGGSAGALRARRVDETLAAAGITAAHPSLYPNPPGRRD